MQLGRTPSSCSAYSRNTASHVRDDFLRTINRRSRRLVTLASKQQDQQTPPDLLDVALSQALTSIGLSGTVAVAGAALCGINIFSLFHWERLQDIQLALELNSVLIFLDALLFLPNYSIPEQLLEPQPKQQHEQQQQQQHEQQQQRFLDVSAVGACSAWDPSSWQLTLAMLTAALRGPQVQQLPLQVSAGLLVAREGSRELLQRGFFLTALAGWLSDRLYEADIGGVEGLVALPGGVLAPVPEVGLLAASLAATVLFSPAAFLAAEEAAAGVGAAMLLNTEAGAAVANSRKGGKSSKGSSSTVSAGAGGGESGSQASAPAAPAAAPTGVIGNKKEEEKEQQQEEEEQEELDPEVLEYRLVKVSQELFGSAAPQLAYRITLAKALGRLMLANVVFVATQQNLAASFAGGVVLNALQLVYSRANARPEVQSTSQ